MLGYTFHHSQFPPHCIPLDRVDDDVFAVALITVRVVMPPHHFDAALCASRSPVSNGALLGDELGLGHTIEAALMIARKWAKRKRRVLLVAAVSLPKQWAQGLWENLSLPTTIMDSSPAVFKRPGKFLLAMPSVRMFVPIFTAKFADF